MNQINRHLKFLLKTFEGLKIPVTNENLLFFYSNSKLI